MLNKYGLNAAKIVVALLMLLGGAAKLAGVPEVHDSFALLGLPPWFGYLIGACEIAGGIGLFIGPLSALAAACLGVIMLGATYFHVAFTPLSEAIPAFVAFCLCVLIAIKQRTQLFKTGRA